MIFLQFLDVTKESLYSPNIDFTNWYKFDMEHGYDSCGLLARIAHISDGLTDDENDKEIERAINEILKYDLTGNRTKIYASEG